MSNNNTMLITEAHDVLNGYIDLKIPTFVWGAPGVGKSELIKGIAAERKWGMIDFRASLRDPVDLKGMPIADLKARVTDWLIPNELPNAKRDGEFGILFTDELNIASQAMMGACFGLILDGEVANYKLPKGWVIIAAGNRMSDRASANRVPSALRNRFAHITIEVDVEAWIAWAVANNIHPALIAFHRFRKAAGMLHRMPANDDENAFPTPRAWSKVSLCIDAPAHIRMRMFEGLVGEGAAAELEGFLRIWKELPSIPGICKSPKTEHVPDMGNAGAIFAVSAALARAADATNVANIFTYAQRLPREFEQMIASDIAKRDPKLKSTKAFIDFGVRNQDVRL